MISGPCAGPTLLGPVPNVQSMAYSLKMNSTYSEHVDYVPSSLADAIRSRLAELDIESDDLTSVSLRHPIPVTFTIGDRQLDADVLYLPLMSATEALQASRDAAREIPLMVIGARIHESSAKTLRAQGIWYIDGAGNAFLRDYGLLVDIRGRRGTTSNEHHEGSSIGPTNPFSPKRAQVVFVLLSRPELTDAPIREIASRAGVSVGIAKETIDTLSTTGFIERTVSYRHLTRRGELLDLWASTYSANLGRANTLFVGSGDVREWSVPEGTEFAVSGEQAVPDYIRHGETLVLYVNTQKKSRTPTDLILRNRWRRDPKGNVILRRMFWRDIDSPGRIFAPPLLVYADLLAAHEPRQAQAAREMRQTLGG